MQGSGSGASPSPAAAPAAVAAATVKKPPLKLIGIAVGAVAVVAAVVFGVYSAFFAPYEINEKLFADDALRAAVIAQVDPDRDGKITRDEAKNVVMLEVDGATTIEGLGVFPSLADLTVSGGALTTLDVEDCRQLVNLDASGCSSLSELKLGDKPALAKALLNGTALGAVDVSRAPALETLNVSSSPLVELSVASNGALRELNVRASGVSALDLSGNPELATLDIEETAIPSLNLEANAQLDSLKCDDAVTLENLSATKLHEYWVVNHLSTTWRYEGDLSEYDSDLVADVSYDDEGKVTSLTWDNSGGYSDLSQGWRYDYEYDESGLLTEVEAYDREDGVSESEPENTYTLSYDEAGRLTSYYDSSFDGYHSYRYDEAGRLVEESSGGSSDDFYGYDDKGNLSQFGWDTSSSTTQYRLAYNEANQIVSLAEDPSSSYYSEDTYTMAYGDNGLLSAVNYTSEYENSATTYTYDENGRLSNVVTNKDDSPDGPYLRSTAFTYDERGFLTKVEPDFNPAYAQDIGGAAKRTYSLGYERVLTVDDSYRAPQVVDLRRIFAPDFNWTFWWPDFGLSTWQLPYMDSSTSSATFAADGSPLKPLTMSQKTASETASEGGEPAAEGTA